MLDLAEQLRNVLKGLQTLDELRTSISIAKPLYCRPSLDRSVSSDPKELQRHLATLYSDYELRIEALERSIEEGMRAADQFRTTDHGKAQEALEAVGAVASLVTPTINRGLLEFRIGYAFWLLKRFALAIPHLRIAEEALKGDTEEGYSRELVAMHYLVDALSKEKKRDETLAAAERFLQRSKEVGSHACEAQALRHIGLIQAELGRDSALGNMEKALRAFDHSSEEERREYAVAHRSRFLDDLSNVARKRGHFEKALAVFRELVELHRQNGNQVSEARALSEIGYTYIASGEVERACEYLKRSADLASKAGDYVNAVRWSRQASAFAGGAQAGDPAPKVVVGPITNEVDAYEAATIIESLIKREMFNEASPIVELVLQWARDNQDLQLEITHLNNLGICRAKKGDPGEAIKAFRHGVQLADGSRNMSLSLLLRDSLATAYLMAGKTKLAYEVLLSAVTFGDILLNQTESMEVRQQIVSSMLPIQEQFASLLSQTGNHEQMIAVTEGVRTRNLKTWMRASNAVSRASQSRILSDLLRDLRAVEIEFEVREIAGTATYSDIRRISETRTNLRGRIDTELKAEGMAPVDWSSQSTLSLGNDIEHSVQPGDVTFVLFGVSEGVCVAAAYKSESNVEVRGSFIPWPREERMKVLAPWIRKENGVGHKLTPEVFDESIKVLRDRLLEPATSLCRSWSVANVLVIPQGELALLPLWDLLELTGARCVKYFPEHWSVSALHRPQPLLRRAYAGSGRRNENSPIYTNRVGFCKEKKE